MSVHCCGCMKAREQFCGSSLVSFIVYMCSGDLTQVTRRLCQLSHLLAGPKISPAYIITILFEAMSVHPMDKGMVRGRQSVPETTYSDPLSVPVRQAQSCPNSSSSSYEEGGDGQNRQRMKHVP